MQNKKQLIDAKSLMKNGWHLVQTGENNIFLQSMSLADVPIVDAVEVVRCFECCKEGTEECKMVHRDKLTGCLFAETKGTDFCSYGERRTDG